MREVIRVAGIGLACWLLIEAGRAFGFYGCIVSTAHYECKAPHRAAPLEEPAVFERSQALFVQGYYPRFPRYEDLMLSPVMGLSFYLNPQTSLSHALARDHGAWLEVMEDQCRMWRARQRAEQLA